MDIERIRNVVSQMTLAEKAELTGGNAVRGIARLNVPSADFGSAFDTFSFDKKNEENLPTALALGCTFSEELCSAVASERADRAIDKGYSCYGSIACGLIIDGLKSDSVRFFSEDPFLAKKMLYAYASANRLGCVFTDALGPGRDGVRTVDERALHELYLRPLRYAGNLATGLVLDGGYLNDVDAGVARAVCDEYCKLIGRECAVFTRRRGADVIGGCGAFGIDTTENKKGIFGNVKTEKECERIKNEIIRRIENGTIPETKLNFAIERIVAFAANAHEFYKNPQKSGVKAKTRVSDSELFFASAALLKNDILPTDRMPTIFGDKAAFDDGGNYKPRPIAELNKRRGEFNLVLVTSELTESERQAVETAANSSDLILAICGVPRKINAAARAVMFCPYCPRISDILETLKGREAKGRLSFTWGVPHDLRFDDRGDYRYGSVYCTHALCDGTGAEVDYPFGHGLAFTEFDVVGIKAIKTDEKIQVSATVRNIGGRVGSAVLQVYASLACADYGVKNRLVGFRRAELDIGEEKQVVFDVDRSELDVYDVGRGAFVAEGGKCTFGIGLSSRDIRGECKTSLDGVKTCAGFTKKQLPSYFDLKNFNPRPSELDLLLGTKYIKRLAELRADE